jgi:hypothetical protein
LRVPELRKGGKYEVIEYVHNLKTIAQVLACTTLSLLEAALGFDKLVRYIKPLLEEKVQLYGELTLKLVKLEEV